jgi:endonuclease YncB( thermonuclease family)
MSARALRLLVVGALLTWALPLAAETVSGRVVGVSDGDTLTILRQTPAGPRPARIRLWGIDCPELRQAWGARAKQFTSREAFGREASAEVRDTDRYGRLVAVVTIGARNLNRELVKAGLAWWYRQYAPNDRDLQALEAEARRARRGLWADPSPTPPWEFRHGKTRPQSWTGGAGPPDAEQATVYVTANGRRYHRAGCHYLTGAVTRIPLRDALARGLTPCLVCKP